MTKQIITGAANTVLLPELYRSINPDYAKTLKKEKEELKSKADKIRKRRVTHFLLTLLISLAVMAVPAVLTGVFLHPSVPVLIVICVLCLAIAALFSGFTSAGHYRRSMAEVYKAFDIYAEKSRLFKESLYYYGILKKAKLYDFIMSKGTAAFTYLDEDSKVKTGRFHYQTRLPGTGDILSEFYLEFRNDGIYGMTNTETDAENFETTGFIED